MLWRGSLYVKEMAEGSPEPGDEVLPVVGNDIRWGTMLGEDMD